MKDATHKQPAGQLMVALAGNPNAGKTTLFNALTGLSQKVANYPGVTVERKTGEWRADGKSIQLIDLPGLYSLDATSLDEHIASDVLLGKVADVAKPDAVIAVVDATNLERNLYLVTQLFEFGVPVVVALTMIDVFEKQKHEIDIDRLSKLLKVPVVAVDASEGRGIDELADAVASAIASPRDSAFVAEESDSANAKIFARYAFISEVVQKSVKHNDKAAHDRSEKIDKILTHRVFGLAILVGVLLLVFQAIFSWAEVPMHLLETGFGAVGDAARAQMPEGILADLVVDGIIAGVGGVLVFLPQILLLFLFISILEDTGYMARAAFLMDKLMSRFGLHGKAFLPLMSSFACAIPGIMATRTIENQRDRFATILIAPFMSCSARLPVYTLMIGAFFTGQTVLGFLSLGAALMLAMYALGIVVAVIVGFILKKTLLSSTPAPFVMELPPYRVPDVRTVLQNMLTRAWLFVKRAGTVILAISIILWALAYFPRTEAVNAEEGSPAVETVQLQNSYAGQLGHLIEPVIRPLGFDWKIGVALIASFAAREVLVSTLSIIYNVGKDETEESPTLISAIKGAKDEQGNTVWTPLTALTLMVFFVLAMQCMSTLAIVRRETNSWRWPIFQFAFMTLVAYGAAFMTYQGGKLLGLE
jgi:ferrous iron transport protein B